jgi:hypothetical protein
VDSACGNWKMWNVELTNVCGAHCFVVGKENGDACVGGTSVDDRYSGVDILVFRVVFEEVRRGSGVCDLVATILVG